jgi:hypothetical protein
MELKVLLAATKQLGEMGLLSEQEVNSTQIKIVEKELMNISLSMEEIDDLLSEAVKSRFRLQIRMLKIIVKPQ